MNRLANVHRVLVATASFCALLNSANAQNMVADYVVALVGTEPITQQQVLDRVKAAQATGNKTANTKEVEKNILEGIINEQVILQAAKQSNIKIADGELNNALERLAEQKNMSLAQLQQESKDKGINWSVAKEEVTNRLLFNKFRAAELSNVRISISDEEIAAETKRLVNRQLEQRVPTPKKYDLGHILIRFSTTANARAKIKEKVVLEKKIQQAYAELQSGKDFAEIAKKYSQAPEGASGGGLGMRDMNEYPTLFIEKSKDLKEGEMTKVFESPVGFHILKLLGTEGGDLPKDLSVKQTHTRHILLLVKKGDSPDKQVQSMNKIKTQLDSKKIDFIEAARKFSEDASAEKGGDLGWSNPNQYVPEFEEVMNKLGVGETSAPMVSRYGVHLIQVIDRRESKVTEEDLREAAISSLQEKAQRETFQTWVKGLREKSYVEYRDPPQ